MLKEYIEFETLEIKMKKLKEWGLLSPKAKEIKKFIYKGKNKHTQCEIVGYFKEININASSSKPIYETAVIITDIGPHRISIEYLKEMQKG